MLSWMRVVPLLLLPCMQAAFLPSAPYDSTLLSQNRAFASFDAPPKTLDPAKAYNASDLRFVEQIYESLYTYDYYKRPYEVAPLSAAMMPRIEYITTSGQRSSKQPEAMDQIAHVVYRIALHPDLFYFPSPYLPAQHYADDRHVWRVPYRMALRRAVADDFVYQIKRLADPKVGCPIAGLLAEQIEGFGALRQALQARPDVPLSTLPLSGVQAIDALTLVITTRGYQPQFLYWLATSFFSPMPVEVEALKGLVLDWQGLGSGAYGFEDNQPYYRMLFRANPYYRDRFDQGMALPKTPTVLFTLEKESIPRWHKFMHGYYDQSAIGADQFAQVLRFDPKHGLVLQPEIAAKGITLSRFERPSIAYWVFNQNDPVVGGNSARALGLREAIAGAFDWQEFIAIFLNDRAVPASGPIPPGIEGYQAYTSSQPYSKRLAAAKLRLHQAGYPNGIDPKTGKPLILHFLTAGTGAPEEQTKFGWMRAQFAKLGIVLNIEVLPFARFLDRLHRGQEQMAMTSWIGDYPDPENFLWLFVGDQLATQGGQNLANYHNPAFDACYERVRTMAHGPMRAKTVRQCVAFLQHDKPVLFGFFPTAYVLSHHWVKEYAPSGMHLNLIQYSRRETAQRQAAQRAWNQPQWWVLWVIGGFGMVLIIGVGWFVRRRQQHSTIKRVSSDD